MTEQAPTKKIWTIFFLYAAVVALLIQLVILPYVVPAWHAGDGLVVSSLDSRFMHRLAADMATDIKNKGWSAWELRPQSQSPSGIAAIFYYFIKPKLWVMIPLNAALHATAAVILMKIVQLFIPRWRLAVVAVIPFFFYAAPISWYAQLHREGYSILGFLFILYGWSAFMQYYRTNENKGKILLRISSCVIAGIFLLWIGRPYLLKIMLPTCLLFSVIMTVSFFLKWRKKLMDSHFFLKANVFLWLMIIMMVLPLKINEGIPIGDSKSGNLENARISKSNAATQRCSNGRDKTTTGNGESNTSPCSDGRDKTTTGNGESNTSPCSEESPIKKWNITTWLPSRIDNIFYTLACVREGLSVLTGKTDIDRDVIFSSAGEIVAYMPRALQIIFLSPFPSQWISEGSYASTTLMKRIASLEMIVNYIALVFLPYALWVWRKRMEVWFIASYCSSIMLVYGITFINAGAIYRIRYGYLMTMVALGISGFITFLRQGRMNSSHSTKR